MAETVDIRRLELECESRRSCGWAWYFFRLHTETLLRAGGKWNP